MTEPSRVAEQTDFMWVVFGCGTLDIQAALQQDKIVNETWAILETQLVDTIVYGCRPAP